MGEQEALAAMAKYGDNHWWESDDPRVFAYYQLRERIFLRHHMTIPQLMQAISALVGRPVETWEMKYGFEELLEESQAAWENHPWSPERVQESVEGKVALMIREKAQAGQLEIITVSELDPDA